MNAGRYKKLKLPFTLYCETSEVEMIVNIRHEKHLQHPAQHHEGANKIWILRTHPPQYVSLSK